MTTQLSHYDLFTERTMPLSTHALYRAWTEQFDVWFAAPGSVRMHAESGEPFYFETDFEGRRHPHYGRFLRLVPDQLVELTWVTGDGGTEGAETVVTVELAAQGTEQTHLKLTHSRFATESARDQHRDAWPLVLEQMQQQLIT